VTPEAEFARVLATLRDLSTDQLDKGKRFERLVAATLRVAPLWATRFKNVWLWEDWPGAGGEIDTGIDLVAEDRVTGALTAIQAKFYDDKASLTLDHVGSFFGLLGQDRFADGMIVTTAPPTKNLQNTVGNHAKPVTVVGAGDLAGSGVDWAQWTPDKADEVRRSTRDPRPHQRTAIKAVLAGFETNDRGKLIMACGTGKTFTGQQIAERVAGKGGKVLVLLPSISLLSQTVKEWGAHASIPMTPFAVCSDKKAGKKSKDEDISPFDLIVPPTTDPNALVESVARTPNGHMSVVFSTYHSTSVITDAQAAGLADFDLIIADEAHRTTGVTLADGDDSNFTRVHDNAHIAADKRLYMTATPRVFSDASQAAAKEEDAWLASMDKEEVYGPEFHRLGFREAVDRGLLTDYRVIVLAVDEEAVSAGFQTLLSDENNDMNLDRATKLVGVLNALAKRDAKGTTFRADDTVPMQTALAFSNTIKASQRFTVEMDLLADRYGELAEHNQDMVVELDHVDGSHNSIERETKLAWLAEDIGEERIRILSNAKCLTEGVDVPSLDAVMFLEPRGSMVDVIQAVGRVMRLSDDKERGYVILPIGIPAGVPPAQALSDHKKYKVVWQVLNALRSHDERLNAVVNQIDLNDEKPDIIDVQGAPLGERPTTTLDNGLEDDPWGAGVQLAFPLGEVRDAIYAQIVKKVGTRHYWEDWANDVAEIAGRHETRIRALIEDPDTGLGVEFEKFEAGLRSILNDSIDTDDAISMLSQHLITRPVFEALFADYDFIGSNPVSVTMQAMIDLLDEHSLDRETEALDRFYADVAKRAEGIDNAAGKQKIITELYERFFAKALPKTAEALGIVYTPLPVVNFILGAADNALRKHFDCSISDEGVHVLDPFTGTGTFIVQLLQSGLIKPHDLARKYTSELHANEVLLLAYYIAAINIEATYHDLAPGDQYESFPGIVYTDTFQMVENSTTLEVFDSNSERARKQQDLPIRVILGNPPYSAGQKDANDNAANLAYPTIDGRIAETYAAKSTATNKNSLYDSYIRALRWASDRVIDNDAGGIVAYVSNGGYIDGNTADGLRLSVAEEFHHLYIYNLRGNQRTAGELSRKEGGKIFGGGSRATVAVIVAVKEPGAIPRSGAKTHYRDIGDYLSRTEKLAILTGNGALDNPLEAVEWRIIKANEHGDWINQRSDRFNEFVPICESDDPKSIFVLRSNGLKTNRDAWNYNSSRPQLEANINRMVDFFNTEVDRFAAAYPNLTGTQKAKAKIAKKFVDLDSTKFSWDVKDYNYLAKGEHHKAENKQIVQAQYRPFERRHADAAREHNDRTYQLPRIYPTADARTRAIGIAGKGGSNAFTPLIVNRTPDLVVTGASNAMQFLPIATWTGPAEEGDQAAPGLFDANDTTNAGWQSNINPAAITRYQALDQSITDEDLFYYVYGILHSPDYRNAFAADLKKSLPRIPQVDTAEEFRAFSQAGRDLAALHLDYESVEPWPHLDTTFADGFDSADPAAWQVEKMRYPKVTDPESKKKVDDKTVVHMNSRITIAGIPERAHDYILGSRSAIDWVLNQYQVKTHKASGIVNDPNDWATEHDQPSYIYDLLCSVVTVSMRTLDIIDALPELDLT